VNEYNTTRPHQAIGMAVPADRFSTARVQAEAELPLRLPAVLALAPVPAAPPDLQQTAPEPQDADAGSLPGPYHGGPVEFAGRCRPAGTWRSWASSSGSARHAPG
jgi:hypothetical protein